MNKKSALHHRVAITARQAQRMRDGTHMDGKPSDYERNCSAEDERRYHARKVLEDLREQKELEKLTGNGYADR